jgi:hypothetical protein
MPSGQECQEDFPVVLVQKMILHIRVAKAPVCNLPLIYTPCPCAVPIIRLPGIIPSDFASGKGRFLRVLTTVYLQRRYQSSVRNFSDVPGKPSDKGNWVNFYGCSWSRVRGAPLACHGNHLRAPAGVQGDKGYSRAGVGTEGPWSLCATLATLVEVCTGLCRLSGYHAARRLDHGDARQAEAVTVTIVAGPRPAAVDWPA